MLPRDKESCTTLIYVAQPYSHTNPLIRHTRAVVGSQYIRQHIQDFGVVYYSPILHACGLIQYQHELYPNQSSIYWEEHNLNMLNLADELHVLQIPGHEKSKGLAKELDYAKLWGTVIRRFDVVLSNGEAAFYEFT